MRMRGKIKILPAIFLAVCLLSGCSYKGKEVSLAAGLGQEELFKIGNEICPMGEALIFIVDQKNMYEEAYTSEIWNTDVDGSPYETYFLGQMKNFLAQLKCMRLMAKEKNIQLTSNEKERIEKAAELYRKGVSEEALDGMKLTDSQVVQAYEDYYLAHKVIDEVTKGVDMEISDDEAKVIRFQQIFIPTYDREESGEKTYFSEERIGERGVLAENALARLTQDGADFASVARDYGSEEAADIVCVRGQLDPGLEEKVFALETGELSELIQTEDGFYIFKSTDSYDQEGTQLHKREMAKQRKLEKFKEEYNSFTVTLSSEFNYEAWDKVTMNGEFGVKDTRFTDIYQEILQN